MMFVACGPSYDVPTALDSWKSDANGTVKGEEISVTAGETLTSGGDYRNFDLTGQAYAENVAEAALLFHSDGQKGYEVLADSNNSSNDLYERETQSLHE